MNMVNGCKILFAFILLAGMVSAGISVANYSVSQSSFKPGSTGVITIAVSNPCVIISNLLTCGGVDAVDAISMQIFSPPEISITGQQFIGTLEAGGVTQISLPFTIRGGANSSIYPVEIRISGVSTPTQGGTETFSRSATIPVTVVNPPILSFATNVPVMGGVESIPLTITNNGGAARNLRISISSASPVALYSTNEIYVGDATAPQLVNMTLDARSASDGAVSIPLILKYDDELGISHTDNASLHLTVKNEVLDLRFNQLSPLVTRQDGTLSLQVTNNGQASLSDVRISFTNASMQLRDKNEILVGDLGPGAQTTVSAAVYPDLTPGLNPVGTSISWVEGDIRKTQALDIPLTIASDADVSVYLDSTPSPLTSGDASTISVLVSNVGSYGIDNVDVGINSSAFESLDITPRQYIGSLAKDDFSTVQFKVMVAAPGNYPIDINVRYRDASGIWVTKDIGQVASVKAVPSSGGGMLYLLVGVVVLAALAVWYFRFRKKG
jgi:uncharacterized membrane protein